MRSAHKKAAKMFMVPFLEKRMATLKFGAELTVEKSSLWEDYQVVAHQWDENNSQTLNLPGSKQQCFKVNSIPFSEIKH